MRIVFFGTPAFSADFLKAITASGKIDAVAVVTQPDEPVGRKHVLTPPPVKVYALERGIPVWQPTKLKNPAFHETLRAYEADLFVVIAYGRILPQAILDLPRLGVVNVHPSLLPKYRGPSPMQAAIMAGDKETGISIMLLDAGMDTGPVLAVEKLALDDNETIESLTKKVVAHGAPLLIDTLHAFMAGKVTPVPQDDSQATICSLLTRADGVIDWQEPSAVIERQIRALNPWPGTSTIWMKGTEATTLKIFSVAPTQAVIPAGLAQAIGNELFVGTGTTALKILELLPAGGKRMDAGSFIRGNADIHGAHLVVTRSESL